MKKFLTLFFCALMSLPADARRFDPTADPQIKAKSQTRQKHDGRLSVDAILLKRAEKTGKDGLISPARWAVLNTRMGLFLGDQELNAVFRIQLKGVMAARDRMNHIWKTQTGVAGGPESREMGVGAVFGRGEFIKFTKDIVNPSQGGGSPLADVLTHGKSPLGKGGEITPQEMKAYDALILDSLRKSPQYREIPVKGADGKGELWVEAPDMGLAVHLREGREPLDILFSNKGKTVNLRQALEIYLETNIPELIPSGPLGRMADRARQLTSEIKQFWNGLGEAGHVRIGKGLTIQDATENLRYVEVPEKAVKAFRGSISEAQFRSVAYMRWEAAARILRARDADKFAAMDQAWVAASRESGMGFLVMEPKAGPALEFAMNKTAPKEMLIKDKVNPMTRRVHVNWNDPDHTALIYPGSRFRASQGDGYEYFFDTQSGKPVSSDFDLGAVGNRNELGTVTDRGIYGYATQVEVKAVMASNQTFRYRGFKSDPVQHGPQSNVQKPVNWSKERMMGFIPGENRRYIVDSPKALADYLNLAAEKGLKFRIPDQWGAESYLKPEARTNIEITRFEDLVEIPKKKDRE